MFNELQPRWLARTDPRVLFSSTKFWSESCGPGPTVRVHRAKDGWAGLAHFMITSHISPCPRRIMGPERIMDPYCERRTAALGLSNILYRTYRGTQSLQVALIGRRSQASMWGIQQSETSATVGATYGVSSFQNLALIHGCFATCFFISYPIDALSSKWCKTVTRTCYVMMSCRKTILENSAKNDEAE